MIGFWFVNFAQYYHVDVLKLTNAHCLKTTRTVFYNQAKVRFDVFKLDFWDELLQKHSSQNYRLQIYSS